LKCDVNSSTTKKKTTKEKKNARRRGGRRGSGLGGYTDRVRRICPK